MVTVSRNATDDFRTESERLAYGSRPYMQFPVFGGGRGGVWGGGKGARRSGQVSNRYISETAKDNPINVVLNTH